MSNGSKTVFFSSSMYCTFKHRLNFFFVIKINHRDKMLSIRQNQKKKNENNNRQIAFVPYEEFYNNFLFIRFVNGVKEIHLYQIKP